MDYTSLKAAKADGTPVSGGTNQREDRLLNNIVEREELRLNYSVARRQVDAIEKGLNCLTSEERLILERFYIHRMNGYIDRLCDELGYERTQIYIRKDRALRRLTMQMYGVIEL